MNKKLLAGLLAASLTLSAVACGNVSETTTGVTPDTTKTPTVTTTVPSPSETTTAPSPAETTTTAPEAPVEEGSVPGIKRVKVGTYLTLQYNEASADVTWEVQKGIGSRENVTLTVKMKDDYLFDGWSEKDAIVNGTQAVSKELTYTASLSADTRIFCNTSMQIHYNANGGVNKLSNLIDTFSVVFHQNPNTWPDGAFSNSGYLLTGYNTEPDGTGEAVSLGSKVTGGKGKIELYCMWEKTAPETDFEVAEVSGGVAVTKYSGTAESVVIPETIGGKTVVAIESGAFTKSTLTDVFIPKTVKRIANNAFKSCASLTTIRLFDTVTSMSDDMFYNCPNLQSVRLHTTTDLVNEWMSMGAAKIDRLIWAKDKKKVIIIGGSGSLYGFESDILEAALENEYEIVNLGENANVTALAYFDVVEDFVGEGDLILWCPEPGKNTLGSYECGNRFWDFKKSDYGFVNYLNLQNYNNFFSTLAVYAASLPSKNYKAYDALSPDMNPYGDNVSDRSHNGQTYGTYSFKARSGAEYEMMDLFDSIKQKGATILFSFAAMQESGTKGVAEDAAKFEKAIVELGAISISKFESCIYEDHLFYDSAWHLTDEGARERSARVAKDLRAYLGLDD